ncbi:MAG TPA: tetratricopeptide repeat protein [Candidatus Eisenbacteria bacterium]
MTARGRIARGRIALLALSAGFAGGALAASAKPGPRLWGIHLLGFLPPTAAWIARAALLTAVALVALGAWRVLRGEPLPEPERLDRPAPMPRWAPVLFVALSAILFWVFRARTHFLGDGAFWLSRLQSGEAFQGHEPLAEAVWMGSATLLRSFHLEVTPETVATFSVLCGAAAMALVWAIAREFERLGRPFLPTLGLLATLGASMLYFGYIESYPPVLVLEVAFLYAGVRTARTGSPPHALAALLAIAIAGHVACVVLIPGYLVVAFRNVPRRTARVLFSVAPFVATPLLMLALGYGPGRFAETVRVATRALEARGTAPIAPSDLRPYGIVSWDHLLDMGNEALLVAPVALLLGLSGLVAGAGRGGAPSTRGGSSSTAARFLAVTAGSGLAAFAALVLPVAPAQDWDLDALLVVPAALAGVFAGAPLLAGRGGRVVSIGVVLLGVASLGSFVAVNADPAAGVRRYAALVGPRARITPFARVYGYELLVHYHRDSGDKDVALAYARALLRHEPTNHRLWSMVGAILYDQHRYDEAIPYLRESIARGSPSAGTRTNLGICLSNMGRAKEALDQFREVAAMEPGRPDHQLNLALGLLGVGEADSARVILLRTIRAWPRFAPARRALERHFGGGP